MFHEENCKIIFSTCVDYFLNKITVDEAAAILKECDLTNVESFEKSVKDQVKTILELTKAKEEVATKERADAADTTKNKNYNASNKKAKKN